VKERAAGEGESCCPKGMLSDEGDGIEMPLISFTLLTLVT
jgi:hypothetical protein